MKRRRTKRLLLLIASALVILSAAVFGLRQREYLVIRNQETGETYVRVPVETGDKLNFGWEHSFEHIPWNEYYEVEKDGSFLLNTISVAGFGAGIPAEMDCTYRYEDGLIYMDDIGSEFPRFNWINSQTALKEIGLNGRLLIRGEDMPHHEKMVLCIEQGKEDMK